MKSRSVFKAIRNTKVDCLIATYRRKGSFLERVKAYCDNVSVDTTFFVVDDSGREGAMTRQELSSVIHGDNKRLGKLIIHRDNKGGCASRNEVMKSALSVSDSPFLFSLDDDVTIKRNCLERYLACAIQEPRFCHLSTSWNYKRWWWNKGWKPEDVVFGVGLGIAILHPRWFIERYGTWHPTLEYHHDGEMAVRAWHNGYYAAAVFGEVRHARSGDNFPTNGKEFADMRLRFAKIFADKYPGLIKYASDGKILRRFRYPTTKYRLDLDDLTLTREETK